METMLYYKNYAGFSGDTKAESSLEKDHVTMWGPGEVNERVLIEKVDEWCMLNVCVFYLDCGFQVFVRLCAVLKMGSVLTREVDVGVGGSGRVTVWSCVCVLG